MQLITNKSSHSLRKKTVYILTGFIIIIIAINAYADNPEDVILTAVKDAEIFVKEGRQIVSRIESEPNKAQLHAKNAQVKADAAMRRVVFGREKLMDAVKQGKILEYTRSVLEHKLMWVEKDINKLQEDIKQLSEVADNQVISENHVRTWGETETWFDFYLQEITQAKETLEAFANRNDLMDVFIELNYPVTKFYPYHFSAMSDSKYMAKAMYHDPADNNALSYLNNGYLRFASTHQRIEGLFQKLAIVKQSENQKLERDIKELIYQYSDIKLFSPITVHETVRIEVPVEEALPPINLPYIPDKTLLDALKEVAASKDMEFLEKNKYERQLLQILYNMGLGIEFIKSLMKNGVRFKVVFEKTPGTNAIYDPDSDTIKINPSLYSKSSDSIIPNTGFPTNALHELFHAYEDQVIDTGKDKNAKKIYDKLLRWLEDQDVIKIEDTSASILPLKDNIGDTDYFRDEYVTAIVNEVVEWYRTISRRIHSTGGDRISVDKATELWKQQIKSLAQTNYDSYDNPDDKDFYKVLSSPPEYLIVFITETLGMSGMEHFR